MTDTIPQWLFLLLCGLLTAVAAPGEKDNRAYKDAYGHIIEKQWAQAEQAFNQFIDEFPQSRWLDDARFWICYSKDKNGDSPENSFTCYKDFLENNPTSEWADDARRNLTLVGKELAKNGKPEFLAEARLILKSSKRERSNKPGDDLMAMLEFVVEDQPEQAADIVIKYYNRAKTEPNKVKIIHLMDDIETEEITSKLVDILKNDTSENVREAAVEVLSDREQSDIARRALIEAAKNSSLSSKLRVDVISELADFEFDGKLDLLRDLALNDPDYNIVEESLEVLVDAEHPDATAMLHSLYDKTDKIELRKEIIDAIADTETAEALNFLSRIALQEKNLDLATEAVKGFDGFPEPKALSALSQVLSSETHWRVKVAALYETGDIETARAVEVISESFKRESHIEIRKAAIDALGDTDHKNAVPILTDIISSNDPVLTRLAIDAMDDLDDVPEARSAMLKLLEARLAEEDQ